MFDRYKDDYFAMTNRKFNLRGGVLRTIKHRNLRFCFWGRLACAKVPVLSKIASIVRNRYEKKYGLEISFQNIGGGLILLHPFNITVNSRAELGKNVTLFKGCTIGSVRSGKREGVPVIGDHVVLCVNSSVVGNVHIGNDVLIAAGAMVDIDVPDHSIALGNPAMIKHKENASKDYMTGL